MEILNEIYEGFSSANEVLEYLRKILFNEFNEYKIVEFNQQYYAIGMSAPLKQIVVCKNIILYKDRRGYSRMSKIHDFQLPYRITRATWANWTKDLYIDALDKGYTMTLFNIKDGNIEECFTPVNCYFLALLHAFTNYFIDVNNFSAFKYASEKNIQLLKSHILETPEVKIISINPFRSKVRVKVENNLIEINYRPITNEMKNYIIGFQIAPIINMLTENKGIVDSTTFQINNDYIQNMKDNNNEILELIFTDSSALIKSLANNTRIELSKDILDYVIENNLDLKSYIEELDIVRVVQLLSKNGLCIRYIEKPNFAMRVNAVLATPQSIKFMIQSIDDEELLQLIHINQQCLKYIDTVPIQIQIKLLGEDIYNAKYFNDISYQLVEKYIDKLVQMNELSENIEAKIAKVVDKKEALSNSVYLKRKPNNKKLSYIYDKMMGIVTSTKGFDMQIVDSEDSLSSHIEYLYKLLNCKSVDIGCGFFRQSGLYLIDDMIQDIIDNGYKFRLIIGSLRDYIRGIPCRDVDKNTAEQLNRLTSSENIEVRTYKDRFYHGKIYYLYGENHTAIICGSSNISKNGMYGNKETNIVFVFNNNSQKLKSFKEDFEGFWKKCVDIGYLDLDMFILDKEDIKKDIEYEGNDDVYREFSYLRELNPTEEIDYIPIFKGYAYENQYSAFYYKQYDNLLILDSLEYQNAVYLFRGVEDARLFIDSLERKDLAREKIEYYDRISHTSDGGHKERVIHKILEIKNSISH